MKNQKLIKIFNICLLSLIVIACIAIPAFAIGSVPKIVTESQRKSEYDNDMLEAAENELSPAQKTALSELSKSFTTPYPKPVPITTTKPASTPSPVVTVKPATEIIAAPTQEVTPCPTAEPAAEEVVYIDETTTPEETPPVEPAEAPSETECVGPEISESYSEPTTDTSYSGSDVDLLARAIFAETGCSWFPEWVRQYTGSVILNRVNSEIYPSTIYDVLYQDGQYTCVYDDLFYQSPPDYCVATAEYLLSNGSVLPSGVIGQSGEPLGEIYAVFSDPEGVCIDTYYFY